jgi:hypothetical protein
MEMELLMHTTRKSYFQHTEIHFQRLIEKKSYNWGGKVLGLNFDDHVGDW